VRTDPSLHFLISGNSSSYKKHPLAFLGRQLDGEAALSTAETTQDQNLADQILPLIE
jgi:hypothetical protein